MKFVHYKITSDGKKMEDGIVPRDDHMGHIEKAIKLFDGKPKLAAMFKPADEWLTFPMES